MWPEQYPSQSFNITFIIMSEDRRPILIIDALNLYKRCFAAYPQMSNNGYQMGGCVGFLKTMRKLIEEKCPSAVYIAWEGGGSQRRRKIFPDYKMHRKPSKLNRFYGEEIPESDDNEKHQMMVLLAMLRCTPVCQLYASDCEADDIIGYACHTKFRGEAKIIASSDKDMYQLLDDSTTIFSLHKKTFVTLPEILETFRVTAQNFAIAKALCGDPSDNIPGIKGFGFKTIAKMFPFLGTETCALPQDIIDYSASHIDQHRLYKRVVDEKEDFLRNWKLVYLDGSMLSSNQTQLIDHVIDNFKPKMDRQGFIKQIVKEGIGQFDVSMFFSTFNVLENIQ
jgi:5'-3' exonuclease